MPQYTKDISEIYLITLRNGYKKAYVSYPGALNEVKGDESRIEIISLDTENYQGLKQSVLYLKEDNKIKIIQVYLSNTKLSVIDDVKKRYSHLYDDGLNSYVAGYNRNIGDSAVGNRADYRFTNVETGNQLIISAMMGYAAYYLVKEKGTIYVDLQPNNMYQFDVNFDGRGEKYSYNRIF